MKQTGSAQNDSQLNLAIQSEVGKQLKDLQMETIEVAESVKDLDLNREGFVEDAMKLSIEEFGNVLKRDDLKCQNEDHVLAMTLKYIT